MNKRETYQVFQPCRLEPMTDKQRTEALHAHADNAGLRAALLTIYAYAAEATALAHNENAIQGGMAEKYLMAAGWLTNLASDIDGARQRGWTGADAAKPRPKSARIGSNRLESD